ncbi:MAG: DNA-formamidopyrimidine glycosylase [Candidatus Coatesbacteria bacterium RBG_13_66_14]|uniref:DNA-formamidopyrimidine glycosylase n=1 Tax=Candidatus Coatesbacteria bacterium RBG_13_66_14 TaxID=1817816 RepID=A0A1F5FH41_9BACT|nr:MAG: DNA-formamidopyrimidine glycosylase [Candidatus Coatesbacteria bacterium RBG_13_66_14]
MPELPEVETIARQLAPLLEGGRVVSVEVLDPRLALDAAGLSGILVKSVLRVGKRLAVELETGRCLRFDLRMTGRLTWSPAGADFSRERLRAVVTLENGRLLFHDLRRLGEVRLFESLDDARPAGFEPLDTSLTLEKLDELIAGCRQPLKVWLLRQDRLAGIGNIYASEIPFAAGLRPERPVSGLTPEERGKLLGAIRHVLAEAITHRGTTLSDYRDGRGQPGGHRRHLRVYGRENGACPRCGGRIERIVQRQRSTYFCPGCQV